MGKDEALLVKVDGGGDVGVSGVGQILVDLDKSYGAVSELYSKGATFVLDGVSQFSHVFSDGDIMADGGVAGTLCGALLCDECVLKLGDDGELRCASRATTRSSSLQAWTAPARILLLWRADI